MGKMTTRQTLRNTFWAAAPSSSSLRNEFAKPERIRPVQSGQDQTLLGWTRSDTGSLNKSDMFSSGMLACWLVGM